MGQGMGGVAANCNPWQMRSVSKALLAEGDISRPGEADRIEQAVVDRYGRLDSLVNNAGGAMVGGLLSLSDERWQADIDLKLLGAMRMMCAAGRSSTASAWPATSPTTSSCRQASSMLALTKAATDELASDQILVNAQILTPPRRPRRQDDHGPGMRTGGTSQQVHDYLVGATPLGRLAQPEDVAKAVLFYASDLATFLTGTSLTIDSGAHRAIA